MITSFTAIRLDDFLCRLDWTSDLTAPTYYVYRDGVLLTETLQTSLTLTVAPDDSPVFEVFDDPGDVPTATYSASATLAWYAASGAASYRVEQADGSDWIPVGTILDDGSGYFAWTSGRLPDGVVSEFRVVPISAGGIEGTLRQFATLIVRYPDVPNVTMTLDAGTGVVTIDLA